ncbi:MAG: hypothetical protein RR990_05190, partial [Lachnospiraceae bacterium]
RISRESVWMNMKIPKCMSCNRFFEDNNEIPTCEAFPEGISHDVMWEPVDKECHDGIMFDE